MIIRASNINDLEKIYTLHTKCFSQFDYWYKSTIAQHINNGIVIELENKDIVGVLLEGYFIPCNNEITLDYTYIDCEYSYIDEINSNLDTNNKSEILIPASEYGCNFLKSSYHTKNVYGILMICVNPEFRNKKFGSLLIEQHIKENSNKILYLNTRKSNPAYNLYKKLGYITVGYIKNKYYYPTEDSIFMAYTNNIYP
jgi:GNAT superfamily N-acetyltransferase